MTAPTLPVFPSEIALLLACARRTMTEADRDAAGRAIARGIDWDVFLLLGNHHGLLPLVGRHIHDGSVAPQSIPDSCLDELRRRNAGVARRSLYLSGELARLLRLFAESGVRVVPLKGPVLAQEVYGEVSLRRFNDLDLFCAQEDQEPIRRLLEARGFHGEALSAIVDREAFAEAERNAPDVTLFNPTNHYRVELHRAFLAPRGKHEYALTDMADRLEPSVFFGVPTWRLSSEDQLVYLCMHGAKHVWSRLEWLCGVAELLRLGEVRNWSAVETSARTYGELERLRAALQSAHLLLGAPVPEPLLARNPRTRRGVEAVLRQMQIRQPQPKPKGFSARESFIYAMRTDDSFGELSARCWGLLNRRTAADLREIPLPRVLHPIYVFLRPIRLAFGLITGKFG